MNVSLLKGFFFIGLWIIAGALVLWSMDSLGLLAQDVHLSNDALLRVDFPAVYDIWEAEAALFIDARSASAYSSGHIPGAVNIPVNEFRRKLTILPKQLDTPIITYCGRVECPNAYQLMHLLRQRGYRNVRFFPRGVHGWFVMDYPLDTKGTEER